MLQLTHYQEQALESLRAYLRHCAQTGNADTAFYETTRLVWKQGISYRPVGVPDLASVPYVCLRLPTGGGKTLLACHAIAVANQEYLACDHSLVLWLVPSNTIREQTLKAIGSREHPYRQALESTLGPVTAMGVDEALYMKRADLVGSTAIIVSTLQAFRVEDKEGRKVYAGAGALEQHFAGLPPEAVQNLLCEGRTPVRSLANVLRLHRPLVIVDEAHNARTPLSFDTLANFRPAAIIEFTATPDSAANPSNVLHSVSAAELKAENMIKLPIRLETKSDWRSVLADAVSQREDLEKRARIERQRTGEYIRPLLLLQAQPRRKGQETLSVEVLREALTGDHRVAAGQVAIATGEQRDLDGIDVQSESCEIRYIITVQALSEGWDCPFAYVLCSVREMASGTAVEQILGRILRLPGRHGKTDEALDRAYAFVTSSSFAEAAGALVDALVENGFNAQEAREFIRYAPPDQPELGLDDSAQPDQFTKGPDGLLRSIDQALTAGPEGSCRRFGAENPSLE